MNRSFPQMFLLAALLALGACAGGPVGGKLTKPSAPPPSYPASQPMALDEDLRRQARNELLAQLNSSDEAQVAHALEAGQQTLGTDAAGAILNSLQNPSPLVRFAAAMAAGRLRIAAAHPQLLKMVADENQSVGIAARFALHRLGDVRFSHDLEKTARSFDPQLRRNTALVLGLLEEKSALAILRYQMRDREPAVRLQAAEAAWMLGDPEALDALVGATVSGYPDDQMIAVLALARPHDGRLAGHVRGMLVTDYPEVNLVAARAMGMLGSDAGYGVALRGAADGDPRRRFLAAMALGDIARTDSQPILAKLLADSDPDTRLAAAAAILNLK